MRISSYVSHYAISRYSIREFNTGADPFMVTIIIIIIIIYCCLIHWQKPSGYWLVGSKKTEHQDLMLRRWL